MSSQRQDWTANETGDSLDKHLASPERKFAGPLDHECAAWLL